MDKLEAMRLASLLNDVKDLKDVIETKAIKEGIISMVLLSNDKAKLTKAAKAVEEALFPKKPGNNNTPEEGGNG